MIRLEIDPQKYELWEIVILEEAESTRQIMHVLVPYVVDEQGNPLYTGPKKVLFDTDEAHIKTLEQSRAFKVLLRTNIEDLTAAVQQIVEATTSSDPN